MVEHVFSMLGDLASMPLPNAHTTGEIFTKWTHPVSNHHATKASWHRGGPSRYSSPQEEGACIPTSKSTD